MTMVHVDNEMNNFDGMEDGDADVDEFGDDDMQRLAEDITVAADGYDLHQFHINAYLERLEDIRFALVAHHDRGMIATSTYKAEMRQYHEVLEWLWRRFDPVTEEELEEWKEMQRILLLFEEKKLASSRRRSEGARYMG